MSLLTYDVITVNPCYWKGPLVENIHCYILGGICFLYLASIILSHKSPRKSFSIVKHKTSCSNHIVTIWIRVSRYLHRFDTWVDYALQTSIYRKWNGVLSITFDKIPTQSESVKIYTHRRYHESYPHRWDMRGIWWLFWENWPYSVVPL